jgi:predicted DNA-binding mobile mystery protein A
MFDKPLKLKQLTEATESLRPLQSVAAPPQGWVRAIREALGMTASQLASRTGIARQSLDDLERNEASGKITLESLDRLARALGCKLVYAIVPEGGRSLEDLRREKALALAREQMERVSHSMKLEDQGVTPREEQRQLERLAEQMLADSPRKLWR